MYDCYSFYMAINISLYEAYAIATVGGGLEGVWLPNTYGLCTIIVAPIVAVNSDRLVK